MTSVPTLSAATGIRLVAEREIRMRLRSKSFLISTGILLLLVLAGVVLPSLFADGSLPRVATVGQASQSVQATGAFEAVDVADRGDAEELVRSGEVEAAVVPADSTVGLEVIALDEVPFDVVMALSVSPEVVLLEAGEENPFLVYLVAIAFGLVFFTSALTFGSIIAQSVVEEKSTRIVEILMAALPVRVLMAGKIVGNSLLAFAQVILIALIAGAGLLASGQDILLADVGPSLAWFIVFFVFGFVLVASLFASTGAMVSRLEDIGSTTTPVTMLVMAPYFLVIFFYDNPLVLGIMSYVPFSSPVGMPVRIFLGEAAAWEPFAALGILIATTVLVIGIAARIYSNSLLKIGARVSMKEAIFG